MTNFLQPRWLGTHRTLRHHGGSRPSSCSICLATGLTPKFVVSYSPAFCCLTFANLNLWWKRSEGSVLILLVLSHTQKVRKYVQAFVKTWALQDFIMTDLTPLPGSSEYGLFALIAAIAVFRAPSNCNWILPWSATQKDAKNKKKRDSEDSWRKDSRSRLTNQLCKSLCAALDFQATCVYMCIAHWLGKTTRVYFSNWAWSCHYGKSCQSSGNSWPHHFAPGIATLVNTTRGYLLVISSTTATARRRRIIET